MSPRSGTACQYTHLTRNMLNRMEGKELKLIILTNILIFTKMVIVLNFSPLCTFSYGQGPKLYIEKEQKCKHF